MGCELRGSRGRERQREGESREAEAGHDHMERGEENPRGAGEQLGVREVRER